jgi:hypothetical protein
MNDLFMLCFYMKECGIHGVWPYLGVALAASGEVNSFQDIGVFSTVCIAVLPGTFLT